VKQITTNVDDDEYEKFAAIARRLKLSASGLLRMVVRDAILDEEDRAAAAALPSKVPGEIAYEPPAALRTPVPKQTPPRHARPDAVETKRGLEQMLRDAVANTPGARRA
jgi:hypothetical protein